MKPVSRLKAAFILKEVMGSDHCPVGGDFAKMKKICLFLLVFGFFACPAFADMIEVRGKGFIDGKIEKEEEDRIYFMDNYGQGRIFLKKDILHIDKASSPRFDWERSKAHIKAWWKTFVKECQWRYKSFMRFFRSFKDKPLQRRSFDWGG